MAEPKTIRGKVHSVTVLGRGSNAAGLQITVDGKEGMVTAVTAPGRPPNDKSCYPIIFENYIAVALAAQADDRKVDMLYWQPADPDETPIICSLTVYR